MSGWNLDLMQDECKPLGKWLANRIDAKQTVRKVFEMTDNRETFEAWFAKAFIPAGLSPEEKDCFLLLPTGMAWESWQAGRKQAIEECVAKVVAIDDGEAPAYADCRDNLREML